MPAPPRRVASASWVSVHVIPPAARELEDALPIGRANAVKKMIVAAAVGNVVATRKDGCEQQAAHCVPMDPHGKPEGNYLVAWSTTV